MGSMRYDATSTNAIEATGLVKRFGKTTALAGVDLAARPGRVLGMLGPNGAGKTTAVRILATLLRPDAGQATVCGYDVLRDAHRVRQLIGLTGQYAAVDEGLSGTNNLIMIGRLLALPRAQARARAAELLARFELTDAAGRIVKTYSGGMRRRLDLAASARRPWTARVSNTVASTVSGGTARRYPAGCDSITWPSPARRSSARSRETRVCRALPGWPGGSSGHSCAASEPAGTTRPESRASKISRTRS